MFFFKKKKLDNQNVNELSDIEKEDMLSRKIKEKNDYIEFVKLAYSLATIKQMETTIKQNSYEDQMLKDYSKAQYNKLKNMFENLTIDQQITARNYCNLKDDAPTSYVCEHFVSYVFVKNLISDFRKK